MDEEEQEDDWVTRFIHVEFEDADFCVTLGDATLEEPVFDEKISMKYLLEPEPNDNDLVLWEYLHIFLGDDGPVRLVIDAPFEDIQCTYFDWWTQRLVEELGRQRGHHARILLTAAAQRPEGVRATTLRTLLAEHATPSADLEWAQGPLFDILENDGYWVRDDLRYRFRSNLLRAYWLRRHAR